MFNKALIGVVMSLAPIAHAASDVCVLDRELRVSVKASDGSASWTPVAAGTSIRIVGEAIGAWVTVDAGSVRGKASAELVRKSCRFDPPPDATPPLTGAETTSGTGVADGAPVASESPASEIPIPAPESVLSIPAEAAPVEPVEPAPADPVPSVPERASATPPPPEVTSSAAQGQANAGDANDAHGSRWLRPAAVGGYFAAGASLAMLSGGLVFDVVTAASNPERGIEDGVGPAAYVGGFVMAATAAALLTVNGVLE